MVCAATTTIREALQRARACDGVDASFDEDRAHIIRSEHSSTCRRCASLAALACLEQLVEAAQRVTDADTPALGEFPHTETGEQALREMTQALAELAAAAGSAEPTP